MKAIATILLGILAMATTAPARAQISDDVVRLGVLTDMSGPFSDAAGKGSLAAVEMAVADYGGTVKGKPIRVIAADHQNKVETAAEIVKTWYGREQVDAVLDVPGSAIALAVQALTRGTTKALIVSGLDSVDFTGKGCSPNGLQWSSDAAALATAAGRALVQTGDGSWFFVTADTALGTAQEEAAEAAVRTYGGEVVGAVRHPPGASDFAPLLRQAEASNARVVALANAGGDTLAAIRRAAEFGLGRGGQKLAALSMQITDAHALGLKDGRGVIVADGFYWDLNDGSRAFAKAFFDKTGRMPTTIQAGLYSATLHYLKAIDQSGTDDAGQVIAQMKATPVSDFFARNGKVRDDGRMVHDLHLFEMKAPEDSKGEWDLYKHLATVPGDEAFPPLDRSECPLPR